jgi:hypothetical protein
MTPDMMRVFVKLQMVREGQSPEASPAPASGVSRFQRLEAGLRSAFPKGAHIGGPDGSVLLSHDDVDPNYALFYAGDFNSTSGGTQNPKTGSWKEDHTITLRNGTSFGVVREPLDPDQLRINGRELDLRKGRVFVLSDAGTVQQHPLFPLLEVARDVPKLSQLVVPRVPLDNGKKAEAAATPEVVVMPKPGETIPNSGRVLFIGEVLEKGTDNPVSGAEIVFRFRDSDWRKRLALARADGKVIPLLAERRVTSDARGNYPFVIPPECEGRDLAIERSTWHPDFVVDRSFGEWMLPRAVQQDETGARTAIGPVRLERGKVVTGQILDAGGQPAHGVPIYVAWQYPEYLGQLPLTRTDDAGRYNLRVPPSRDQYRIFVLPADAIPLSLRIAKGFGNQPVVRLSRGKRIRGRVTDAAGKGVADVVVQGNGDDSVYHGIEKPLVRVRTDAEGRYELPPLPLPTDVRVLSEGWTGAWQRLGEKLVDVYLPTFAQIPSPPANELENLAPDTLEINFTPVESVILTAHCMRSDGSPMSLNIELYGTPPGPMPENKQLRWRGRFADVPDQPGHLELRVPNGLTDAAIDLMHDGQAKFSNATRAVRPSDKVYIQGDRTEVRYDVINADDDTIEIRLPAPDDNP